MPVKKPGPYPGTGVGRKKEFKDVVSELRWQRYHGSKTRARIETAGLWCTLRTRDRLWRRVTGNGESLGRGGDGDGESMRYGVSI